VPFVTSSPGLGKSSIFHQIAEDFGLVLIDLRLSQCAPEDLMGLPMREGTKATFAPFKMFPLKGDALPKGKNGWLLLLDEFNSAVKSVQAAAYKIVLDRMIGQEELHEQVWIACAGNLATDRAIVNQQGTAMQSRLIHLEMEVSHTDFMRHAAKNDFDHRVMGFLEFQPSRLHDFRPDHQDKTFACPRTWEFASKLIKGKPFEKISLNLLAGTVSGGVAVEFHTFMQEYDKLPLYSTILAEPKETDIPVNPSTRFALITLLMDKVNKDTFPDVVLYVKRMPPEFQVIFFRGTLAKDPSIKREQAYADNIMDLTEFLHGDDSTLAA
jgi:hypothetical protein